METGTILWTPEERHLKGSNYRAFLEHASKIAGYEIANFAQLHAWSVTDLKAFWSLIWDFNGVVGDKGGSALGQPMTMPGAKFFPRRFAKLRREFAEIFWR